VLPQSPSPSAPAPATPSSSCVASRSPNIVARYCLIHLPFLVFVHSSVVAPHQQCRQIPLPLAIARRFGAVSMRFSRSNLGPIHRYETYRFMLFWFTFYAEIYESEPVMYDTRDFHAVISGPHSPFRNRYPIYAKIRFMFYAKICLSQNPITVGRARFLRRNFRTAFAVSKQIYDLR
jgi:hypothetical protein